MLEVAAATAQSLAARGKEVQSQLAEAAKASDTNPVVVVEGNDGQKTGEIEDNVEEEVPPLPPSEVKVYPTSGKEEDEKEKKE